MHAIAYDPIHDEIVVPQIFGQGILFFRGGANGEEPPLRYIQGPQTQLQDPDHVAIDPVHNEVFVPQHGHILVYPRDATGNVAPIRDLSGPDTRMGVGDQGVMIDPLHDLMIVTARGRILIFNRTDQGNVKPKAVIGGPNHYITGGAFALYPEKGEIIISASARGGRSEDESDIHPSTNATTIQVNTSSYVGVWNINDNGDVPAHWTIGGPDGVFRQIHGIAVDPKNKEVIVTDKRLNAIMTFAFPEIF